MPAGELSGCSGNQRPAQEPDPAVLSLETTREVTVTKILVSEKWVLNKSFWIRRKFDITGIKIKNDQKFLLPFSLSRMGFFGTEALIQRADIKPKKKKKKYRESSGSI